jgi:hypothetical protein
VTTRRERGAYTELRWPYIDGDDGKNIVSKVFFLINAESMWKNPLSMVISYYEK